MLNSWWAALSVATSQVALTQSYELSDFLRESLDSPIPSEPSSGYITYSEVLKVLPRHHARHTDDPEHTDLEEYHADDELSSLCGQSKGHDDKSEDVPPAKIRTVDVMPQIRRNAISAGPHRIAHSDSAIRFLEQLVEETTKSCSVLEEGLSPLRSKAQGSSKEIVHGTVTSKDVPRNTGPMVYELLRNRPVDPRSIDEIVDMWQRQERPNSITSPLMPPPSFLENFCRSATFHGLNSDTQQPTTPPLPIRSSKRGQIVPRIELMTRSEEELSEPDGADGPADDQRSEILQFAPDPEPITRLQDTPQNNDLSSIPVFMAKANPPREPIKISTRTILRSIRQPAASFEPDLLDYKATFAKVRGDLVNQVNYTPEMVRKMISVLNQRSTTVKQLSTYWEGQHEG